MSETKDEGSRSIFAGSNLTPLQKGELLTEIVTLHAQEMTEYREQFRQYVEQVRPQLEALAAGGDEMAAQLLADAEEMLQAELRFVPDPDSQNAGYTLAWVLPEPDGAAAIQEANQ